MTTKSGPRNEDSLTINHDSNMKEVTTKLATLLMRTSLRLNGWTDAPKPEPHQQTPQYPWWRKLSSTKIEVSDFIGAFRKTLHEAKKP